MRTPQTYGIAQVYLPNTLADWLTHPRIPAPQDHRARLGARGASQSSG